MVGNLSVQTGDNMKSSILSFFEESECQDCFINLQDDDDSASPDAGAAAGWGEWYEGFSVWGKSISERTLISNFGWIMHGIFLSPKEPYPNSQIKASGLDSTEKEVLDWAWDASSGAPASAWMPGV